MFTAVGDNELWTALLVTDKVSTKDLPLELGIIISHTAVSRDITFQHPEVWRRRL